MKVCMVVGRAVRVKAWLRVVGQKTKEHDDACLFLRLTRQNRLQAFLSALV